MMHIPALAGRSHGRINKSALVAAVFVIVAATLFYLRPRPGSTAEYEIAGKSAAEKPREEAVKDNEPTVLEKIGLPKEKDRISVAEALGRREKLAAKSSVSGIFRASHTVWPGGGVAELHPSSQMPEGGFMGLFSEALNTSRSKQDRQAATASFANMMGQSKALQTVKIDSFGAFTLLDPKPGQYEVKITHPFFRLDSPVQFAIAEGEHKDLGSIATKAAGSLLILVADSYGRPVVNAKLRLQPKLDMSQFMDPSVMSDLPQLMRQFVPRKRNTDARGSARFEGVEPNKAWFIQVESAEHVNVVRAVEVLAGRENIIRLELLKGAEIAVLVRGPDRKVYANAHLRLSHPDRLGLMSSQMNIGFSGMTGQQSDRESIRKRSDKDGLARFKGVPVGRAVLRMETPGFLHQKREFEVTGREGQRIEFTLDRGLSLAGRVFSEDGRPIEGASVANVPMLGQKILGMNLGNLFGKDLLALGSKNRGVLTDAQGRFVLFGLKKGERVHLLSVADDHDYAALENLEPGSKGHEFHMLLTGKLSGKVVDERTGEAVTDFEVACTRRAWLVMERTVASIKKEAAVDGSFELTGIPRQSLKVVVKAEGRAPWSKTVDFRKGTVDLGLLRLLPPAGIKGVVLDPNGKPVSGARVRPAKGGMMDNDVLARMFGAKTVKSGEKGEFLLTGLAAKRMRILADKDGYAQYKSKVIKVLPGQITKGVVIKLSRGGTIVGTIRDAKGLPLGKWRLQANTMNQSSVRYGVSDANGTFRISGLRAGTYQLDGFPGDYMERITKNRADLVGEGGQINIAAVMKTAMKNIVRERVVVRDGEESKVDLVYDGNEDVASGTEMVRVEGDVRVGGRPLPRGVISFFEPGSSLQYRITEITNGKFVFEGVKAASYRVRITEGMLTGNIGMARIVKIPQKKLHGLAIDLPGGRLSGRVLLEKSGAPVAGVLLSLGSKQERSIGLGRMDLGDGNCLSDADGRFRFDALSEGVYAIFAKEFQVAGQGRRTGRLSGINLAAGQRQEDLVLYLGQGGSIQVRISDSLGPAGNAIVTLLSPDGRPMALFHKSLTDSEGEVLFPSLPKGSYRLGVDAPAHAPLVSQILDLEKSEEKLVELSLKKGVPTSLSLEGALPRLSGGESLFYSVFNSEGALLKSGSLRLPSVASAREVARSGLKLGSFSPGRYRIRVESRRLGFFEREQSVPTSGEAHWVLHTAELGPRKDR